MCNILAMSIISMDQPFLQFNFACLHIFKDIDVAHICRNQEVSIVNKDKYIQDLLSKVHDVFKQGNKVTCLVLSLYFLLINKVSHDCPAIRLISVVLDSKK